MKKRILVNDDAASLWDELQESESIEIVGGTLPVTENSDSNTLVSDLDKDHTVTIWSKSF